MGFEELELDARLQRAIAKLQFNTPTLIQETAIPLALEGKDILARARTGSGKTAAYLIPVLQKIIAKGEQNSIQALILVPTKELSEQVTRQVKELAVYCNSIKVLNLSYGDASLQSQL
jgi:ATP-dependent RNA helicase DDX56/DBP9